MKKRKTVAGVFVALGLIIALCVALMFAKYKINLGEQSEITSKNFYFSSNFLKPDEEPIPTYEIYGNTVTFEVRNYIDSLRINDTDISYTVTAPTDGGTVDISSESGTLTRAVLSSQNITLSYNFLENEDQKEITVSVTGTEKFTQTLKATFKFIKYDGLKYEIKDRENRDYAELYIYTGKTASNVTINWDKTKHLIDETNDYVFRSTTLNAEKNVVTVENIPANTTVKIVFFKKDIKADNTSPIKISNGTITIS